MCSVRLYDYIYDDAYKASHPPSQFSFLTIVRSFILYGPGPRQPQKNPNENTIPSQLGRPGEPLDTAAVNANVPANYVVQGGAVFGGLQ